MGSSQGAMVKHVCRAEESQLHTHPFQAQNSKYRLVVSEVHLPYLLFAQHLSHWLPTFPNGNNHGSWGPIQSSNVEDVQVGGMLLEIFAGTKFTVTKS